MVLLDTSFIIDFLEKLPEAMRIFEELERDVMFVGTPSIAKLWLGVLLSKTPSQEKNKVEGFLKSCQIISLDEKSAKYAAEIEFYLRMRGQSIGTYDIQIAAIAQAHGEILVTGDADFARIEGLRILKY